MATARKIMNVFAPPKANTPFSEGHKSKGIIDDYAVRKLLSADTLVLDPVSASSASELALGFGSGNNLGFFKETDTRLTFVSSGVSNFKFDNGVVFSATNGGARFTQSAGSSTAPVFTFVGDTNTGVGRRTTDELSLIAGGIEAVRVEDPADLGATETSLWVFDDDNNQMEQVTVGAADSGGAGFKVLRIAN